MFTTINRYETIVSVVCCVLTNTQNNTNILFDLIRLDKIARAVARFKNLGGHL